MSHLLLVSLAALAALVAGAVNAVAGGGTFLAFPALTGWGLLSEKAANIACTLGLWPGSAASVAAVARDAGRLPRGLLVGYTLACLAGGAAGSWLLLHTPEAAFRYAIPWLLLFATAVFAASRRIAAWSRHMGARHADARHPGRGWAVFIGLVQFAFSVYGGYFGAGMGILTLAGLSLVGDLGDVHQRNVMKVCLSTATNLTAAVVFLFGPVRWDYVGPMAAASVVGGFAGMLVAKRLPAEVLRWVVLGVAVSLTAAYFWQVYGRG